MGEVVLADLDELPLHPTLPRLHSERFVTVDWTGVLHSDLSVLVDTLGRLGTDTGPGGGDQDVDIVDVSPAPAGGVQHLAALQKIYQ